MKTLIIVESIERKIYLLRGHKVILDRDLAVLYDVLTGALNRAVKRNRDRFPKDFMFQLTPRESENLKCQIGISSWGGDRRALPYAFTEQGVAMLSSVLRSRRAARVNIAIMRAFVRIREVLATHKDLAHRLDAAERDLRDHGTELGLHAKEIQRVFDAIRRLTDPVLPPKNPVGFTVP
jgi:hypothetical protein